VTVRAAGGIVARVDEEQNVSLLVVHRPRYGDWTFPKGKAHPDETDEECAIREVFEETGLVCVLSAELPATTYIDARRRKKRVRYWLMRSIAGDFERTREVDEARWVTIDDALRMLSYERDRELLRRTLVRTEHEDDGEVESGSSRWGEGESPDWL
jgi:8-oxo-dGTP diphosphatase